MSAKRATILCFSQRGPGTSERTAKKKGWGRRETKKGEKTRLRAKYGQRHKKGG